ncbi:MAG TPA: ABC transporter ATP-binding protein [Desulfomonilia bacterium]|nr:ABC transporter ATP-binding protein [Desulfomonilia bacterium]
MILKAAGISKSFMGIHALIEVSIEVFRGEILGVIGPNGAGKTTFFNVLTGLFLPETGRIELDGKNITRLMPHRRVRLGMARTFQNLEIFRDMSVLENVMVGGHCRLKTGYWSSMFSTWGKMREEKVLQEESLTLLARLGLSGKAGDAAVSLSYGNQRRVEIARALASKPAIIFLDEPAAGMNPKETQELSELIVRIKSELDLTVVIIEHDMNLIMDICDRIVVMTEGRVLCSGAPHEIRKDRRVLDAYLGGDIV